jgi:uncharacterized protein
MKQTIILFLMLLNLSLKTDMKPVNGNLEYDNYLNISSCMEKDQLNYYPIQPVEFTEVKITDQFWYPKIKTNHYVTIPACVDKLYSDGRIKNFKIAGGLESGHYHTNQPYNGPIYKVMEGVAYSIQTFPEDTLAAWMDTIIYYFSKAQEEDGYLYPARTIMGDSVFAASGKERWENLGSSHELFNMGHMIEAAIAHHQATGKDNFLEVALKASNLIDETFGFGRLEKYPGHQEIEMALVRLFRETGDQRFLELAKFLLDVRGPDGREYVQAHEKVVDQEEAVGHAVRAVFMYSAMADVAALTNEPSYIKASRRIWEDIIDKKMYITGGIGSLAANEGFEEAYMLPNMHSYCETCASIGKVYWNHRMFLHEGNAEYIDILERSLYNALLSGVSLSGDKFFYPNVLESHGQFQRSPWFNVACCPTSMVRFIPSFPGYIYARSKDHLYVNLYVASEAEFSFNNNPIKVIQETNYPWEGKVALTLEPEESDEFYLALRIPGWAREEAVPGDLYQFKNKSSQEFIVSVNGKLVQFDTKDGYFTIKRTWEKGDQITLDIPMPVRIIRANENIVFNRDRVAIQKGPLVYCAEGFDNPDGKVINLILDTEQEMTSEFRKDLLGGVNTIYAKGYSTSKTLEGDTLISDLKEIRLIPYHLWANRGPGEMRVWLATDKKATVPSPAPTLAAKAILSSSLEQDRNHRRPSIITALNDQVNPDNTLLREVPFFMLSSQKTEWVQYTFSDPEKVSKTVIYWTNTRGYDKPESWTLQFKDQGTWSTVQQKNTTWNEDNAFLKVEFDTLETKALRLNINLKNQNRIGILEWIVE